MKRLMLRRISVSVVILSAIVSIFANIYNAPSANAVTLTADEKTQCMAGYNNKANPIPVGGVGSALDAKCKQWCPQVTTTVDSYYRCDVAANYEVNAQADAKAAIINPAIALLCKNELIVGGSVATSCSDPIGPAYDACAYNGGTPYTSGTPNTTSTATDAAKCMIAKLGASPEDLDALATAITTGRTDADTITKKAADKQALYNACITKGTGWTWDDTSQTCIQTTAAASTTTCSPDIGALGWIICPIVNFMSGAADGAFGVISKFLLTSPSLTTDANTVKAWEAFRNIANILFVVAFMIIVFSQVTNVGIGNYGIKKLLPRLIIAAILVNASLIICQIAVDLSNILGNSLSSFLGNLVKVQDTATAGTQIATFFGGMLAGAAAFAGLVVLALCISIPVLAAILLSVAMIVIILIARNAIILLLIIVAPIAFVAYLLPNTESLFKKWYKMFYSLLLIYPIIGLLYGAGKLAAIILNASSGSDWTLQLAGMSAAILPLALTPMVLKGSLKATGELGSKLSNMSSKANGQIGKKAKDSSPYQGMTQALQHRKNQRDIRRAKNRSGASGPMGALYDSLGGKDYTKRRGYQATALEKKEEKEAADNAEMDLTKSLGPTGVIVKNAAGTGTDHSQGASHALAVALKSGDTAGITAATNILLKNGAPGREVIRYQMAAAQDRSSSGVSDESYKTLQSAVGGANLKGSDNVLATAAYSNRTGKTIADIASSSSTFSGLSATELAGQSADDIRAAIRNGGLSPKHAYDVLNTGEAAASLSDEKKAALAGHAAGYTPPPQDVHVV